MQHLHLVIDNIHEAKSDIDKLRKHIADITDKSDDYVNDFISYKNGNRIKGEYRDIYYWLKRDASEFISFIDNLIDTLSKNKQKDMIKSTGAKLVCETEDWLVYHIFTHEAAQQYGKNTKWCITEPSDFYWRRYLLQSYSFYFCIRKNKQLDNFDKIALQCRGTKISRCWDSLDNSYSIYDLKELNLPDIRGILKDNSKDKSIGNGLTLTPQHVLKVNVRKLDPVTTLPGSVGLIPNEAFANSNISEVVFTDHGALKHLNAGVFLDCDNLKSAKLPDGLLTIGNGVFHSCSNLEDVKLPETLCNISAYCFKNCESLPLIKIPNNVVEVGDEAFSNCRQLRDIWMNTKVSDISDTAFAGCSDITIHAKPNSYAYNYAKSHSINVATA